jgi:hypothetical protein
MLDLSTPKAPFDIALPYGLLVTVKPRSPARGRGNRAAQETGKQVDLEQRRRATLRPRPLPPSPTGKRPISCSARMANGPGRAASSSTQMWSGRSQVLFDPGFQ